jgi:hypothetical protein
VVNYSIKQVYGSGYPFPGGPGPDYHGDFYQAYGRKSDFIIYGGRTVPGGFLSLRGIVGSSGTQGDIAIVNTDIAVDLWVFSWCGNLAGGYKLDHFVVKNTRLSGASDWCGEGGIIADTSQIVNVLFDHSVFENGHPYKVPYPYNCPGIRYVPALGTSLGTLAMPVNFHAAATSASSIQLIWNDVVNESGYKLERSTDGVSGWMQVNAPTVNTLVYTNSGLSASTTYYYRLRAWNGSGDGAWSTVVSAATAGSGILDRVLGRTPAAVQPGMVMVYDMAGRMVMTGKQSVIHKQLSRGVYFIKTSMGVSKVLILN